MGGLFLLLPILLLYLLISEALDLIVVLATLLADLFQKETFDNVEFPVIIGLVLIFGVSFVTGLGQRSKKGDIPYEKCTIGLLDSACGCAYLQWLRISTKRPNHADAGAGRF